MLADWYFCCCIKAPVKTTTAYLAILDTLAEPSSDLNLVIAAVEELRRCDIWMRAHALPKILKLLTQNELQKNNRAWLSLYFEELFESLPEDVGHCFRELQNAVISESSLTTQDFEKCISTFDDNPSRPPSDLPYLDLRDFLPETILLAILASRLAQDIGRYGSMISVNADSGSQLMSRLVSRGLAGHLGRMAFVLANEIAGATGNKDVRVQLIRRLWQMPGCGSEPDLLLACAKLQFIPFGSTTVSEAPLLATEVLDESVVLTVFREGIGGKSSIENRVLPEGNETVRAQLPIVFWQITLCELAMEISVESAAVYLSQIWKPRWDRYPQLSISGPVHGANQLVAWRNQLVRIFGLSWRDNRSHLPIFVASSSKVDGFESLVAVMSPWMLADTNVSYEDFRRYQAVSNRAALARLLGAMIISARILRRLGTCHLTAHFAASLLVHGTDVLLGFGKWFRKHSSDDADKITHSLPQTWTSFAMFANGHASAVGRCTQDLVDPQVFVQLLWRSSSVRTTSDQERVFRTAAVPAVLTQWVMDGFPGIVDQNGTARWLHQLPEIYNSLSSDSTSTTRVQCATLMRFLRPEVILDIRNLDWRDAEDKRNRSPREWSVNHRQLFLVRELSALEWLRPQWKEPNQITCHAQLAVRAVERRSALREPAGLHPETVAAWEQEWLNELGNASDLPDLDRFLRVRLLELLDEAVLSSSEVGQTVITMLILDYGSHYDLQRLLNILFSFDGAGSLQPAATVVRGRVRRQFIEALVRFRARADSGLQDRTEPRAPLEAERERKRLELVEAVLWRLCASPDNSANENHSQLVQLLDTLCKKSRADAIGNATYATGAIDTSEFSRGISWDLSESTPQGWSIRGIICNWTRLTFRAVLRERDIGGASNLFEWSRSAILQFDGSVPSDKNFCLVGILLDKFVDRGVQTYVVNCGLKEPVRGRMSRQYAADGSDIKVGEIVAAKLKRIQGADSHYWRIMPGLRVLPPKELPEVPLQIRIQIRGRSEFELIHPVTGDLIRFDPADWDSNLCRALWMEPLPTQAHAIRKNDRCVPLDKSPLEMLLETRKHSGHFFVATFLGHESSCAGNPSYRISLGLGDNYLIPVSMFSLNDVAAIEEKLRSHPDPAGLLISVSCATGEAGTYLELWKGYGSDETTSRRYPGLATPFDDRNLTWKELDEKLQAPVAVRKGAAWMVDITKVVCSPFPQELSVILTPQPKSTETEVEFYPTRWDYRTGTLRGEPVAYHNLREPEEGRLEFIKTWTELAKGSFVSLWRAYPKIGTDLVMCLTQEGIAVFAESDSLTMEPYPTSVLGGEFFRYAQVINHIEWRRSGPDFEVPLSELPDECRELSLVDGVLASAPQAKDGGGSLCSVWWHLSSKVVTASLSADELVSLLRSTSIQLRPGMRVVASKEDARWRIHFENRFVKVRALWRFSTVEQCGAGTPLKYLGEVHLHGERVPIAEVAPGELLPLSSLVNANHLACRMERIFEGGIAQGERVAELNNRHNGIEDSARVRASRLRFSGGILCGVCLANSPHFGELTAVKMSLHEIDEEYFTLRRQFIISAPTTQALPQYRSEEGRLRDELTDYLKTPVDLDVIVRRQNEKNAVELQRFQIPDPGGSGWTSKIEIAADEGPYLSGISYPLEGVVRIFEVDEGYRASFRRPPPLTPEQYRESVFGASTNETVVLAERLFYVGEEPSNLGYHRFEWRFGCTLVAHELELLFDGGAFSNARGVLFPGDSITRLQFVRGIDSDHPCIIAIEQVNVELSEITRLFRQQRESGVVHLLNLEYLDSEIKITSVIGCAETSSEEFSVFEQLRTAHLDHADETALVASRQTQELGNGVIRETILGRLDGERFLNSMGQEVAFRHVRMAFTSSESDIGQTLHDGELLFMQAGAITAVRNDSVLELWPYPGLRKTDIGPEWNKCGVLRRRFSVRDDLLTQLLARSGKDACKQTIFLVRVNQRRDQIHASIVDGPPRHLRALAAAIDDSRTPLLATIDGVRQSRLRLELQPGLFYLLPFSQFEYPEADFERGTSIRVQRGRGKNSKHFVLARAAMSDGRYVPASGRPAIALPKNVLLRAVPSSENSSRARFWEGSPSDRSKSFTIAGLPGVEAVPGALSGNPPRWFSPDPTQFTAMMLRRHPDRAVLLSRDDRDFRIAPLNSERFAVGSLSLEDVPAFKPFVSAGTQGEEVLPWMEISFLDASIADIQRQSKAYIWTVHDTHSGTWKDGVVEWDSLEAHNVMNGPLFFSRKSDGLTLRFREEEFRTFGYPVQELLDWLAAAPKRTRAFCVAGCSSGGGLWLELAPGRISELPGQLITLEIPGREISISNFAWNTFAPGDQVVLRLSSDKASRVDRIVLLEWHPGARGFLGRGRSFLPVIGFDSRIGSLELGTDSIKLTLPARESISDTNAVLLPNNSLISGKDQYPVKGDTILIGIEHDAAVILGMSGVTPVPDRQRGALWAMDPLADEIRRQLVTLLRSVGGALPVTVETFVPKDNILYFSRRNQISDSVIAPGTILEATLLGNIRDTVLLRCGNELLKVKLNDLLPGIPAALGDKAIHELKMLNQSVWIRLTIDKQPAAIGISFEGSREFVVEAVCVIVGEVQNTRTSGIICRALGTLSLYWLPMEECAWVRLSESELEGAIASDRSHPFPVRRLAYDRPGAVTATGVLAVQKEFDRLAPGATFDAKLVSMRSEIPTSDSVRWLAIASGVGVLLECEVPKTFNTEIDLVVRLEVSHRTRGQFASLSAVPLGSKKYALDLPVWMTNFTEAEPPEQFRKRLKWQEEDLVSGVIDDVEEDLDRKVIYISRREIGGQSTALRTNEECSVARAWIHQNQDRPELDPALAIMVMLILYRNGHQSPQVLAAETGGRELWVRRLYECRREALRLLRHAGRRALHSAHVEVLSARWLCSMGPFRTDDLARRLDRLRHVLASTIDQQKMRLIRQFCRAAELRSSPDLATIAEALRAAIGDDADEMRVLGDAVVTAELIALASAVPEASDEILVDIPIPIVTRLENLLSYIHSSGVATTLLDFLPVMPESVGYERVQRVAKET